MKNLFNAYIRNSRFRRFWRRVVSVLACVVVFVTTYALIMPAITIGKNAQCGTQEHQHTDSCYEERLVCGQEESEGHTHTEDCYSVSYELECGLEEHSHSADCYDEEGNLTCAVPEHTHDEDCYREDRVLSCGLEETEGHTHTDDCYDKVLVCEKEEHIHSPSCYEDPEEDDDSGDSADASATVGETGETAAEPFAGTLTFEGPDYTVTVSFGEESGIPSDAVLSVTEITQEDKIYEEYREQAEKAMAESALAEQADVEDTEPGETTEKAAWVRLFDISILSGEKVIEPLAPVSVQIIYNEVMERTNNAEVKTVHFEGEEETPRMLETTTKGTETSVEEVAFDTDTFSVFAIIGTTIEKNILASDGNNYKITVTLGENAGIPVNADLRVREITSDDNEDSDTTSAHGISYEEYVSYSENALEIEEGSDHYIRLFDISIVDQDDPEVKYQPAEGSDVNVTIELSDAQSDDLSVVHFSDGDDAGDIIEDTSIQEADGDGRIISFQTGGFSVYAIVGAPDQYSNKVLNVDELAGIEDLSSVGFYLSYGDPPKYFTNNMNKNGCFAETNVVDSAAVWFFEPVEGQTNQYYIYTYTSSGKQYIKQKSSGSKELKLDTTGTAFDISNGGVERRFYIKHAGENMWLQHSNGGGGIRLYTNNTNNVNSRIALHYADAMEVPDDYYQLDGKTAGIVYDSGSIFCSALMSEDAGSGSLKSEDMTILETQADSGSLFVPLDSDITDWTFHSAGGDKYYITTPVNEQDMYLTIINGNLGLTSTPEEGSVISVVPGTDAYKGYYSFSVDGTFLAVTGEEGSRSFIATSDSNANCWMKLAEKSSLTEDDYLIYTAKKIRAFDPADEVVLYTRVWNGSKYEFYAVNYDGSLIRCYDGGDVIKWVGPQYETAYWKLTDYYNKDSDGNDTTLNGYHELQNTYTDKYLSPGLANNTLFSDDPAYLILDGRYYQEDTTKIKCWDSTYYAYMGLKVDLENNRVVPCPSAQADDFYFAIVKPAQVHLTEVDTVDNNDYGIKMKMIDFNNTIKNDRDSVQTQYFGLNSNSTGLLTTDIGDNGYPGTTHNGGSLGNLFSGSQTVNHLFIQSIYDESGYFEFDSTKNFAYLPNTSGNFEVYDQLGTVERPGNYPTMRHGQFMPYNSLINPETGEPWPYSEVNRNTTDVTANSLSENDPRYGEGLHEIPKAKADYFFGMEMSADFTQTADGLDAWGHDIIFEFSGDDDFWFYVDDELVLDLGGVHQAMSGSVNFRTGEVQGRDGTTTLRSIFESNYRARNPQADNAEVEAYLNQFFDEGETVFRDFSTHHMKIYYMERGAGASNLHMRFNLTAVKPGEVTLTKKVTGSDDIDYSLMEFPYQICYLTRDSSGREVYKKLTQNEDDPAVTYQGSGRPVKFADHYTPVGETEGYDDVFFLKPGEIASIDMPDNTDKYKIVECGVNMNIFKSVKANGENLSEDNDSGRHDYETSPATIEDCPKVEYENEVDPDSLRTLTVSKVLWDENGYTVQDPDTEQEQRVGNKLIGYDDDETTFEFRLSMSAQDSGSVTPVRNKAYYVKDPNGFYCRWDPSTMRFVSLPYKDYADLAGYLSGLAEEERMHIVFETSIGGSYGNIPAGYSAEFRGLPVDSSFKVEERAEKIPAGYSLLDYERDKGSYISQEEPNQGTIRANEDPHILVHNKRGWGLTVKKVWSDADYMETHDDIYFAVYIKNHSGEGGDASDGTGTSEDETLLEGSVRKMASPATSLYYYFEKLSEGTSFEDYRVYEVRLTDPVTDEDGNVTSYSSIEKIGEKETLYAGGTTKDGVEKDQLPYEATYTVGEASGVNDSFKNVREDTVTNTRRGVRLIKTDWNGAVLPGAVFTLKKDGQPVGTGTYTSDADGLITIAYLDPGTSVLEETAAPSGFQKPSESWSITLVDDRVSVEGEDGTFEVQQATDDQMATVTLKNKGFSLQALKVAKNSQGDATDKVLENARFALYRQVSTISGMVKDQNPMEGYEALTTGADGIIPKITSALPPGTYYLTETNPPDGCKPLEGNLVFTISADGVVSIPSRVTSADPQDLIILNNLPDIGADEWISQEEEDGNVLYTIRIPNDQEKMVSVWKTDAEHNTLTTGADFTLYKADDYDDSHNAPRSGAVPVLAGTTGTNGILNLGALAVGEYRLVETKAPDGYETPASAVKLFVEATQITALQGSSQAEVTKKGDQYWVAGQADSTWQVRVWNNPGVILPYTGGPGTRIIRILGALLIIAATGIILIRKCKHRSLM